MSLLAGSLALVCYAQSALSPTELEAHEQAVLAARAGQFESAISVLESLRSVHPDDRALLTDLVVVLAWAEKDQEALSLAGELVPDETPVYASLPIAKSARNLQRYDDALRWYEAARRSEPDNIEPLLGLVLTRADTGDPDAIEAALEQLADSPFSGPRVDLARAYALRALGQSFAALSIYDTVLAVEPENREALRSKALLLRSMLLPTQALELAEQHPGILTDAEMARLRSDEVAIRVRLAGRTPLPAPESLAATDSALELLESYLEQEADPGATVALRLDRVVALSDANRPEDAIRAFEELPPDEAWSRPYVLGAVARSYLQARRPNDALTALEAALELDSRNLELQFALVYTYLDLERYKDAFALSRRLAAEVPLLNQSVDGRILKINEYGLRAEMLAGFVEAYGDQLELAQKRFEQLLAEAPGNVEARQELANIYRWRGWLDRSLSQYRQILANDSEMLSARVGHAHAQIDAREYEAVAETVAEISAAYPREPAAAGLNERWQLHNQSELDVAGSTSRATGNTFGTKGFSLDARWYTAPIAYRYRAFVHTHDTAATFPEAKASRRRIGAGLDYRATRWTAAGEISAARDGGSVGIATSVDWRLSDTWSLGAGVELDSDDVQLRAHRLGIESDVARVSAQYAANESFAAGVGVQQSWLSDGNGQQTLYADARFRFVNKPRWKLDLTSHLASTTGDLQSVPYFSPERASIAQVGLRHEFRLYRRYERDLTHLVQVGTGRYDQARYPAGTVWRFMYELRWRLSNSLAFGIGAERAGNYYDGNREHSTSALLTLNARF